MNIDMVEIGMSSISELFLFLNGRVHPFAIAYFF